MDGSSFVRAIIQNPGDDVIRLIYADWLDERGDPYGEFIRVQIELAIMEKRGGHTVPGGPCDGYRELTERQFRLLQDNHTEWLPNIPAFDHNRRIQALLSGSNLCEFHRGFIRSVTIPAQDWIAHHAITESHPVETVNLETWPRQISSIEGRTYYANYSTDQWNHLTKILWPKIKFVLPTQRPVFFSNVFVHGHDR